VASTFITCGKSRNSIMRLTSNSNTIRRLRREGAVRARARARGECFVRRREARAARGGDPRARARYMAIHDPRGSSRGYIIPAHNLGGISRGLNNAGKAFRAPGAEAEPRRELLRFRGGGGGGGALTYYRLSTRRDHRARESGLRVT